MGTKLVGQQYYIVPWSDCADDAIMITKKSYSLKHNCKICEPSESALTKVENDATLLIDGHGTQSLPLQLSAKDKPVLYASVLAKTISETWKLPKGHVKIRMLGCYGVGFAQCLAVELGKEKYDSIVVAGYHHSVSSGGGRSPVTGRGTNAMVINDEFKFKGDDDLPEDQRITWFNKSGSAVSKPQSNKTITVITDEYG